MAQANAVQREPSMEEILASIRRIIEDSDQPASGPAPSANDDAPVAKAVAPATAGAAPVLDEPDKAADVDEAAFRAELDEAAETRAPARSAGGLSQVKPLRPAQTPRAEAAEAESGGADMAAELVADAMKEAAAAAPAGEPAAGGLRATAQPAKPQAVEPARSSIISEQAGRQVAAAFGELSDAFAASRRRSFDEVAEDMMRPMLQEWMDNNLPHLVERLVREEIERIARGHSE
ncbi:MAG: DUF2497 domain-containing protein [Rhizobiaceae bacterium]|nr:DUF2497 domain-containing protein [Rhizobiaceae bacterium]MCV0409078.1 DUF2497 domain-containing protein [Rhizobiaceae bacterium]